MDQICTKRNSSLANRRIGDRFASDKSDASELIKTGEERVLWQLIQIKRGVAIKPKTQESQFRAEIKSGAYAT
jgi:hypothetical protein